MTGIGPWGTPTLDEHSLELLEFGRVAAAVAAFAETEGGAKLLTEARPIGERVRRSDEHAALAEAIRREREPGAWLGTAPHDLRGLLDDRDEAGRAPLDGAELVAVRQWLEAAGVTREAWSPAALQERFPRLSREALDLPALHELRERLARALEPDGRVSDAASPALKRARAELEAGERELQHRLERWARGFGESAYVTRHQDRFVALVPAAGFSRRRAIVHDVSGSGQSLFVEPLEICESNNRLTELRAAAGDEERRVLVELRGRVLESAGELLRLEEILVHLDALRARARWAAAFGGIALEPGGERLRLVNARHAILATGSRRDRLVPLDLELGAGGRLLLVSGPNMGGKSVLLKTVGLSLALSHAAFPVLADEGSRIPEVDTLLVDLGDEQSLDQGLSTFAAHLRSLAAMAEQAGPRTLLLCDELGAGTDPEEGAALGRALVERFAARGSWAIVTTHLGSLKRLAGEIDGVVNGSLEIDPDTMEPRYRFVPGIPGASHALAMAERMGLDAGVLARARTLAPEQTRSLERLLEEVHEVRRKMDEEARGLAEARAEATQAAASHREATEEARRVLEDLKRRLTRESGVILSHARELWQTIQREARRADKSRAAAADLRERIQAVEAETEALDAAADQAHRELAGEPATNGSGAHPPLGPGSRVRVRNLGLDAELVEGPDGEGKVLLRKGSWSIHSHVSQLEALAEGAATGKAGGPRPGNGIAGAPGEAERSVAGPAVTWEADQAPPLEVDLRGMEVEEALRSLDQGLDRGILHGLSELRIIHGIGRGVLRGAVERHLRDHPQVASARLGQLGEGGRGVTVARLR